MSNLSKRLSALEARQPESDVQPSAFVTLNMAIHEPEAWTQLQQAYDNRKNAYGHTSRDDILAARDKWQRRDFGIGYGQTAYNPNNEHVCIRNIAEHDVMLQTWDDITHCWQLIEAYRLTGDIEAFKQDLKHDYRYSFGYSLSSLLLYWRDKNRLHGQLAEGINPLIIGLMFCFSTIYKEHYPAYYQNWIIHYEQLK